MDKKELREKIYKQILEKSCDVDENIEIKANQPDIEIYLSEKMIGTITINFLSRKPLGAIALIFLSAKADWDKQLIRDKEEFLAYTTRKCTEQKLMFEFYPQCTSSFLFKDIEVGFYLNDKTNIEEKIEIFCRFVYENLICSIVNIYTQKRQAINNILKMPTFYPNPEILILLLCKELSDENLISEIEQSKDFQKLNSKIFKRNKEIIF